MRQVILGLVLLGLFSSGCSREAPAPAPPAKPPQPQPQAALPPPSAPPAQPAPEVLAKLGPATYDPRGRRDPFAPLVEAQTEEKGIDVTRFKLAGIVWRQDGYFALVEAPDGLGHILKVNDAVGPNARVKEITKDAVVIEVKNRDILGRGKVQTIRLELRKEGE